MPIKRRCRQEEFRLHAKSPSHSLTVDKYTEVGLWQGFFESQPFFKTDHWQPESQDGWMWITPSAGVVQESGRVSRLYPDSGKPITPSQIQKTPRTSPHFHNNPHVVVASRKQD
jgi:hypothetical protein